MENIQKIIIENVEIKQFPNYILPANPNLKVRAKALRQARNLPEVLFWMQVTSRPLKSPQLLLLLSLLTLWA